MATSTGAVLKEGGIMITEFEGYKLDYSDGKICKVTEPGIDSVQLRTLLPWWLVREVIWCYENPLDILQCIDDFFQVAKIEKLEGELEDKFFRIFWLFENRLKAVK